MNAESKRQSREGHHSSYGVSGLGSSKSAAVQVRLVLARDARTVIWQN